MNKTLRILALILALIFATCALCACAPKEGPKTDTPTSGSSAGTDSGAANTVTITVQVVGKDGNTTTFTIETAQTSLRGALEQEQLVQGEEGPYGLYIKTVNGETADYDTDGAYWAVYEGDQYAMDGVEDIKIVNGATYKLVYTKG